MNITGSAGLFRVGDSFVAKNNRNLYYFEKGEIEVSIWNFRLDYWKTNESFNKF